MRKYKIEFEFKAYKKELNYSAHVVRYANNIFEARETFFKNHNKDHFFVTKITEVKNDI